MDKIDNYINEPEHQASLAKIIERCKEANLKVTPSSFSSASSSGSKVVGYKIDLSKPGFRSWKKSIYFPQDLIELTQIDFENIAFLENIEGIYNTQTRTVEVTIVRNHPLQFVPKRDIFGKDQSDVTIEPTHPNLPTIRFGEASEAHAALLFGRDSKEITLQLTNVNGCSSSEVEQIVRKYAAPVLVEIESLRKVALRIRRINKSTRSNSSPYIRPQDRKPLDPLKLSFPLQTYDTIPTDLLLLAFGFNYLPSLKFLFAYQALEFFFIRANRREAFTKIRQTICNTNFNPENENDISALFGVMKTHWVNPAKEEVKQLSSLIRLHVGFDSLNEFLTEDQQIREHIAKPNAVTDVIVLPTMNPDQLITEVAKRLYSIRNAVVHAKEDEQGVRKIIYPQTVEEQDIDLDCYLAVFLAKEILTKNSTPI